jgi:hypothetical protein
MKLFNHVVEFHTRAKRSFTDFKVFKRPYYTHVVWGKFSLLYGQPHLIPVTICEYCNEETTGISAGDESWTYCENCQRVEVPTLEVTTEEYEKMHG